MIFLGNITKLQFLSLSGTAILILF